MNQSRFFSVVLLIAVLSACSKDDDLTAPPSQNNNNNNNPPDSTAVDSTVGSYEANEALVDPNASTYFICDVEGIDSIQKINLQNTRGTCDFGWGKGYCSTGYYQFNSKIKNLSHERGRDMLIVLSFRGKCPACTMDDLVNLGPQQLQHLGQKYMGVGLTIQFIDTTINYVLTGPGFASNAVSASMQEDDELEVLSMTERSFGPTYNIKVRFNLTLTSSYGTIRLKNAIYSAKI